MYRNRLLVKPRLYTWEVNAAAFYLMPDRARGSVEDHGRIIAALKEVPPDPALVERLAREHELDAPKRLRLAETSRAGDAVHFASEEKVAR